MFPNRICAVFSIFYVSKHNVSKHFGTKNVSKHDIKMFPNMTCDSIVHISKHATHMFWQPYGYCQLIAALQLAA